MVSRHLDHRHHCRTCCWRWREIGRLPLPGRDRSRRRCHGRWRRDLRPRKSRLCIFFRSLCVQSRDPDDGPRGGDVRLFLVRRDGERERGRGSPLMRELLARLLQKDARLRLHDIADGRLELEDVQAHPADAVREIVERGRPVTSLVVGIAIGAVVAAMTLWGLLRGSTPVKSQPVMEFEIELPAAERLWTRTLDPIPFALSPDGQQLVFIGGRGDEKQIYVRSMSERATRPVLGTEGVADTSLFVSPDGRWVGFSRDRTLWRTLIGGGIPVAILESTAEIWFAHWSDDDSITYNQGFSSLYRVSADGGEPRPGRWTNGAIFFPSARFCSRCSRVGRPSMEKMSRKSWPRSSKRNLTGHDYQARSKGSCGDASKKIRTGDFETSETPVWSSRTHRPRWLRETPARGVPLPLRSLYPALSLSHCRCGSFLRTCPEGRDAFRRRAAS